MQIRDSRWYGLRQSSPSCSVADSSMPRFPLLQIWSPFPLSCRSLSRRRREDTGMLLCRLEKEQPNMSEVWSQGNQRRSRRRDDIYLVPQATSCSASSTSFSMSSAENRCQSFFVSETTLGLEYVWKTRSTCRTGVSYW